MHRAAGLAVGVRRSSSRQELHHHARRPSWQGQHPARRRLPLRYWRWLAPLCVVTFVGWVKFVRHLAAIPNSQWELPAAVLKPHSPSAWCDARLSAVLPATTLGGAEGGSQPGAAVAGGGWAAGVAGVQSPEAAYTSMRRKLYQALDDSLASQGLRLGGEKAHQGLALGDLFRLHNQRLQPVHTPLSVPVRAVVIPVSDPHASALLHNAARRHLLPILPPEGVWLQNSALFHSTVFHASTHTAPVPALREAVQAEAEAIAAVARHSCPLRVVLERVVATPSGTVLACWQLAGGTDPTHLRRALRLALPNAPAEQTVKDEAILHTTLARVVAPPVATAEGSQAGAASGPAEALQRAVQAMTRDLCGIQAVLDKLWFVEEQDRLALALEGRFSHRALPLQCKQPRASALRMVDRAPGQPGR